MRSDDAAARPRGMPAVPLGRAAATWRVRAAAGAIPVLLLSACSSSASRSLPTGDSTYSGRAGAVVVAAANTRTGKFIWRLRVKPSFEVFSGMVVDGGTLYGQWANCSGPGGKNAGVAAIDLTDGAVRWRTPALYNSETLSDGTLLSTRGGLYVVAGTAPHSETQTVLVAIDAANGKVRWTRTGAFGSQGAFDQSVIVMTSRTEVIGVDRATGRTIWSRPLDEMDDESLVISDDESHVYLSHDFDASLTILALAAGTGHLLWRHVGNNPHPGRAGSHVVAVDTNSALVGLDADTGRQVWQRSDVASWEAPTVDTADGRVVESDGSVVHVIDVSDGKDLWSKPASGLVVTRTDGIALVTGDDTSTADAVFAADSGLRLGRPAELTREEDQIIVAPEFDAAGRTILARGCPGRG